MRADPSEPGGGREVARDHGVRLGFRQLGVLLHRQWLVKRRSALATTLEIFIPVLLMSLLVLGSDLSVNRTYRSQMFADKGIVNVNSKDMEGLQGPRRAGIARALRRGGAQPDGTRRQLYELIGFNRPSR